MPKIVQAAERQYQSAKAADNLILSEEFMGAGGENMLCLGDNKVFMKTLLESYNMEGKINLIYIDPPFFSKANYDAVVKVGDENLKHTAYGDKWEKGLPAYLRMLTVRLMLMKDLLASDGLIWLHLDWHAVHYVKLIMDEIFGEKNFVNEVIWTYKSGGTGKRHFSRKHDTLLVYGKSSKYNFYPLKEKSYNRQFKPYRFKGVKEYRDDIGWYTMVNMKDVWSIDMVGRTSSERTGYATQKPEILIERIIESCSSQGDICADFFCGSGTLPAVAARMNRKFIGCDSGFRAVEGTIGRLANQGEAFRLYRLKEEGKSSVRAEITAQREEVPGSDKELIRITLKSMKGSMSAAADDRTKDKIRKILKETPLQMVESWSVDFNYRDGIHRPDMFFFRKKGKIETSCEKTGRFDGVISVKVVDVFGNAVFERF